MKKILSIITTVLLLLVIAVSCAQDVTVDAQLYNKVDTDVFMLNGKYYATLQEAVNARLGKGAKAAGDNDDVIYLRKNAAGPGAVINDPNTPVVIDFAGWTYSFKDVTATEGSTTGSFGLSISGGSEVTLKGTSTMTLFDSTANLTMVYIEGASTKLTIEGAPKMKAEPTQYVFWAANGATLTIGKSSEDAAQVTGGIAVSGTATSSIKGNSVIDGAVKATGSAIVFIESTSEDSVITNLNVEGSAKVVVSNGEVTLKEKEAGAIEVIGEGTVDNETGDASAVDDTNIGKNTIINGDWNTLYKLQEALISENYGKTITLVADVDLSGYVWTSVGNETNPFRGTVDGNGHIIKNLKSTTGGLISCVGDGVVIKDLTLKDVDISGGKVGGFINTTQYASATGDTASLSLINCDIDGGSITSTDKLGGLIGEGYAANSLSKPFEVTITGCDIRLDTLSTSKYRVGGLVGYASGFIGIMSDCSVTANPVATGTNGAGAKWVGGIFGGYGTSYCVTIDNIEFNGTAQSVVKPAFSSGGNFYVNNASIVDSSGQYLVGCIDIATATHTEGGSYSSANELNEKAYAITCSANHYVLGEKTDPNYHNLSWSNDDGKLYYYSNGYMTSHTDAPTWAGTQYGVLASGSNQNTPMANNQRQGSETGLEPMADSANPNSLLWLVVTVIE